jgi:5' nucleotidase family
MMASSASCILMIRSAAAFAPRAAATTTVVLQPQRRLIQATFDDGLKIHSKSKRASSRLKASSSYDLENDGNNIEQHLDGTVTTTAAIASKDNATPSRNSIATAAVIPVAEYEQKKQTAPTNRRYDRLLEELGLNDGRLEHVPHLAPRRRVTSHDIFCNRELNMAGIRAVGFDMDYTLAQYKEPAFDRLAFDSAKEKLVYNLGYPKEVLDFEYDNTLWARGLIIDTQRGNFLKIDRHKYVRVANHGFDRISSTTRKHLYSKTFNKITSFNEKHFVNMDTLFQVWSSAVFIVESMKER